MASGIQVFLCGLLASGVLCGLPSEPRSGNDAEAFQRGGAHHRQGVPPPQAYQYNIPHPTFSLPVTTIRPPQLPHFPSQHEVSLLQPQLNPQPLPIQLLQPQPQPQPQFVSTSPRPVVQTFSPAPQFQQVFVSTQSTPVKVPQPIPVSPRPPQPLLPSPQPFLSTPQPIFPSPQPILPSPQPLLPLPVQPVVVDFNSNALMPQLPTQQMAQVVGLDVSCSKESMIVRINFDRVFSGLIYSKGFYSVNSCRYVEFNSNRDFYEFTIRLESCGSQFIDEFASGGQAYLENVIIIQNEPGIQEIWDISRRIRCLWEGSLEKTVTYTFNVDMLDSQIVAFSGDTANAFMDIQIGKGPFASPVNGLVKIGETLTMVISVEGDPNFDIHVKDCIAHEGNRNEPITLTDSRGCVLKKKLMGPWQKTRQTSGRNGVSIIAYAFFQAFKFPDHMDVFLECNIELCKNQCNVCPEDASSGIGQIDVRTRSRRDISRNATVETSEPVRLAHRLRVLAPEDISFSDRASVISLTSGKLLSSPEEFCMSVASFTIGLIVMLLILIGSSILTALLCIKVRSIPGSDSTYPDSSFHAFSSVSGKY